MKKYFLLFILILITGCGNKLVGTWEYYNGKEVKANVYYIFEANNTGSYTFNSDKRTFVYSINDNKLKINYNENDMQTLETEFVIENNVLKMKNSFDENVMYKKR